jgi:hypothetical protein
MLILLGLKARGLTGGSAPRQRSQEKKVESVKTLAYKLLLEYVYFKNKQLTDESTSRQRLRVRIC